mmetsp:Transcript_16864/g.31376  ORF Transcript_16864/g.31376 Transcript_16864/m.31376 type:complete len:306 (-) Transcript_16864:133-1050(-)
MRFATESSVASKLGSGLDGATLRILFEKAGGFALLISPAGAEADGSARPTLSTFGKKPPPAGAVEDMACSWRFRPGLGDIDAEVCAFCNGACLRPVLADRLPFGGSPAVDGVVRLARRNCVGVAATSCATGVPQTAQKRPPGTRLLPHCIQNRAAPLGRPDADIGAVSGVPGAELAGAAPTSCGKWVAPGCVGWSRVLGRGVCFEPGAAACCSAESNGGNCSRLSEPPSVPGLLSEPELSLLSVDLFVPRLLTERALLSLAAVEGDAADQELLAETSVVAEESASHLASACLRVADIFDVVREQY